MKALAVLIGVILGTMIILGGSIIFYWVEDISNHKKRNTEIIEVVFEKPGKYTTIKKSDIMEIYLSGWKYGYEADSLSDFKADSLNYTKRLKFK